MSALEVVMSTKQEQQQGRPAKDIRIPDTFENVVKALVKPVKKQKR